jgi:hypothetical protein
MSWAIRRRTCRSRSSPARSASIRAELTSTNGIDSASITRARGRVRRGLVAAGVAPGCGVDVGAAQWREAAPDGVRSPVAELAGQRIEQEASKRWGIDIQELVALGGLQELDRQGETALVEREQPQETGEQKTQQLDTAGASQSAALEDAARARALADVGQGTAAIEAVRQPPSSPRENWIGEIPSAHQARRQRPRTTAQQNSRNGGPARGA